MNEGLKHDVITRIIDKLYDYEGRKVYSCDLGYTIFEGENVDGSFTYNSYEAKEWIKNNFDDIGEVWEELTFQFGGDFMKDYNLFDNPEKFMVLIILESASYLLSRCKLIDDNWNNEITLTKKNIKTLVNQLKELDNNGGIYEN